MEPNFVTLISEPREDYTLIDSGNGRKYESYGDRRFILMERQFPIDERVVYTEARKASPKLWARLQPM
jgi:hypothetical protein